MLEHLPYLRKLLKTVKDNDLLKMLDEFARVLTIIQISRNEKSNKPPKNIRKPRR